MSENFGPEDFAGKWVSGEIGNGPDPEIRAEHDPSEARPTQEDIDDRIESLNSWRSNEEYDQKSYNEWRLNWQAYANGTKRSGTGEGFDGWKKEDFQAVFNKLLKPKETNQN